MTSSIDLERARREAKALLREASAGDPAALARLASSTRVALADAQRAVARELGFGSWPALVRHCEALAVARGERVDRLVLEATRGRHDRASALLALAPGAARSSLAAALVLGDARVLARAIAADPDVVARDLPPRGWKPLLYVTYSAFLGGERTEGLLECARGLLDAGADVNAAWLEPQFGPQSALAGAAGVAHEPRMTALLLERGADPDDGESLFHAAHAATPECLRLLLEAGATVPRTNALGAAIEAPRALEKVTLLLDDGPGAEVPWGERDSALGAAVQAGDAELLSLLVARGADLEAREANGGRTPYGLAVRLGRSALADRLVQLGARREVGPIDELLGACWRGDRAEVRRLAAARPRDAERVRTAFAGALAQAAGEGRRATVELLVQELAVPLGARGEFGGTALHAAAWRGFAGVVAWLLGRGADPRQTNLTFGATPLASCAHGSFHAREAGIVPLDGPALDERAAALRAANLPEEALEPGGDHVLVAELLVAAGAEADARMLADASDELAAWLGDRLPESAPDPARPAQPEPDYAETAWMLQAEYLRLLAESPAAESWTCGDGFAVRTGLASNAENGVVCSAGAEVVATLARLGGAPATWLVGAESALGPELVAAGCVAERQAVVMGARIADVLGAVSPSGSGAVDIHPVRDQAGLGAWIELAGSPGGLLEGEAVAERRRRADVMAGLGLDAFRPVQHRLAVIDGEAVALATVLAGAALELLHLLVAERWRRQGIGRALVLATLRDAYRAGGQVAVLGPTPESAAFYQGLGFVLRPALRSRAFYVPLAGSNR